MANLIVFCRFILVYVPSKDTGAGTGIRIQEKADIGIKIVILPPLMETLPANSSLLASKRLWQKFWYIYGLIIVD